MCRPRSRSAEGMSLFDASGNRHFTAQAREVFVEAHSEALIASH